MSATNSSPTRNFDEWDEEETRKSGLSISPVVMILLIAIAIVAIVLAFFIGRATAPQATQPAADKANSADAQAGQKANTVDTSNMSSELKKVVEELPTNGEKPLPGVKDPQMLDLLKKIQAANNPKRTMGPADAKVKVIEYSDYSCPMCTKAHQTLDPIFMKLAKEGVISFEVRDLNIFAGQYRSDLAATAALAAAERNKFWEYRNAIFAEAGSGHPTYNEDMLTDIAKKVGITDLDAFRTEINSSKFANEVQNETNQGHQWGLQGTPGIFIGNAFVSGAYPPEIVNATIIEQLKEAGY